jgi:HK97 family phage portal protein
MAPQALRHPAAVAEPTALARITTALASVFRPRAKQQIGNGYLLPLGGGIIPTDWPTNFWQMGYNPLPAGGGAVVYACVAAYAQTTAMCPGTHWRSTGDGGRERVATSALSRILKRPNNYQSISDFLLNLTGALYDTGNAYALALRNNRYEVAELHLMDSRISAPRIATNGEIFYNLSGNPIIDNSIPHDALTAVPARDVLHIRLDTRNNRFRALIGEPPLTSALLDIAASNSMVQQALSYSQNQSRPSGVLMTDEVLEEAQTKELRARWEEVTTGAGAGRTPILTGGVKWEQTATTSRDAQLAEMLQITDGRIASVYRMPLELLSLYTQQGAPKAASTENLMRFWIASGLGFCLNHIEEAIGGFFGLAGWPDEYLELDTAALERSNLKDRIAALAQGVQGGIFSPNEARRLEDLPEAEDGDEPRVQQQVVPLSAWSTPPPATPAPDAPASSPPSDAAEASPSSPAGNLPNANQFADSILRAAARYDARPAA